MNLNVDVASFNVLSGHSCECCQFLMGDHTIDVFDNLAELEISLPTDVKETLVYIAGYIIHKEMLVDDTFNYFSKFGDFTNEMSRGGLAKPTDTLCQFVFFAYIIFHEMHSWLFQTYIPSTSRKNMDIFCQIFS